MDLFGRMTLIVTGLLLTLVTFTQCFNDGPITRHQKEHSTFQDFFNQGLTLIPHNLPIDTEYLILDQNDITNLTHLKRYRNLKYLTIRQNHITSNDDLRGIHHAKDLTFFDITGNGLITLNMKTFQHNTELNVISFNDNPDIRIDGPLPYMPNLEKIFLEHNNLTEIPWKNFSGVPNLKILNLLGNGINDIPKEVIESMPHSLVLLVDHKLCLDLSIREDVIAKMISLNCTSHSNHLERSTESSTNIVDKSKTNLELDKNEGTSKLEYWLIASFAGILIIGVIIYYWKSKKSQPNTTRQVETSLLPENKAEVVYHHDHHITVDGSSELR